MVHSLTCFQDHGTIIKLEGGERQEVELSGYAYSGGGRRVIIAELSFDNGRVSKQRTRKERGAYVIHFAQVWQTDWIKKCTFIPS